MERNLIILGIGIAIGYFIFKQGIVKTEIETISPGDKSKDIEGMQKAFEIISKLKFSEYGVYDEDTLAAVQYLMKGTNSLKNSKGVIDKAFVSDISKIYNNSLTV